MNAFVRKTAAKGSVEWGAIKQGGAPKPLKVLNCILNPTEVPSVKEQENGNPLCLASQVDYFGGFPHGSVNYTSEGS